MSFVKEPSLAPETPYQIYPRSAMSLKENRPSIRVNVQIKDAFRLKLPQGISCGSIDRIQAFTCTGALRIGYTDSGK